jgi:hypothetical protein
MNERINQLANEAGLQPFEDCGPKYVYKMEKFAELIVRECCFVGEQYAEGLFDMKHYDFVNKKIKEHFGVEEW